MNGDSICRPNYRGNLEKPVKENIKLSDRKKFTANEKI